MPMRGSIGNRSNKQEREMAGIEKIKFERGSEWRKWDLHMHTPSSDADYKGDDYNDLLVSAWREHGFSAVAITDHFCIDAERIQSLREKAPEVTVFPGVELRTDKGSDNIHVILIFSDDYALKTLSDDFNAIMMRSKAKNKEDLTKIYWDFKDIVDFAQEKNALISLHAGSKTSGIDDKITNALEVAQAIKSEYAENAHIFEMGKLKDIEEYKTIVFPKIQMEKPLVICSDNHNPQKYEIKEYLWIKADPTFSGLKQVVNHPSERVYIGNTPPKVDKSKKNPEKYINSVKVQKKLAARNNEKWFDFELPLNTGLVSVIGNKGSGKSAFSDIIAHACCSRNIGKASFLSAKRFRSKSKSYANDYESEVIWKSGIKTSVETLQEDRTGVELVKYLPQSYIEDVCNELDNSFQKEINNVIFSYIDVSERGSAESLEQIISNKTSSIDSEISELIAQINELNKNIIKSEYKCVPAYKISIQSLFDKQKADYEILRSNPPEIVAKPTAGLDSEKDIVIQNTVEFIEKMSTEIKKQQERINTLDNSASEMSNILTDINEIEKSVANVQTKIDNLCKTNNELVACKIEFSVKKESLENAIELLKKERVELVKITSEYTSEIPMIDESDMKNSYEKLLNSVDSIDYKIKLAESYKSLLTNETTIAQRQYQKYLDDIKQWENKKSALVGDIQTKDSIEYLRNELDYIDKELFLKLKDMRKSRRLLIEKIFNCFSRKVSVYEEIYRPIENKISKLLSDIDDEVNFTAKILRCLDIGSEINKRINKTIKSHLYRAEGDKKLNDIIDSTDFSQKESVLNFTDQIFECITTDTDIEKIVKGDRNDFCNFIANLDYLDIEFNLTMGGLTLEEMSPGQRGTVLLIFYLALDKDDSPLIIDQPEDNLDNQSVFDKLVPCILSAKMSRQIIIVTHNPNIAIACDAEQIITCKIDKHTHEITYTSGAIEKSEIKDNVVKILVGTQPAFDLRSKKYSFYGENISSV
jgi:ABC-type lipoprotein export system ATPase subunit